MSPCALAQASVRARGVLGGASWLLGAGIAALALAAPALALVFPLEIESREGSTWLFVLAARAGVSIYDHQRLAFANMNHGPGDPLLKTVVAGLLPWLEPWHVTRFFVAILPCATIATALYAGRSSLAMGTRLLFGATGFAVWSVISSRALLVGRSDATAMTVACAMVALWFVRPARSAALLHAASGALAMAMVLVNWRYAPLAACLAGWPLVAGAVAGSIGPGRAAAAAARGLAAALLVWAACFVGLLHADWDLYYRHFFGFFTAASGWGLFPGSVLATLRHLAFVGLVPGFASLGLFWLWAAATRQTLAGRERALLALRAGLFCLYLAAAAMALHRNLLGGENHYFVAPLMLLWAWALESAVRDGPALRRWFLWPCAALGLYFAVTPSVLLAPARLLAARYSQAQAFMAQLRALNLRDEVKSEGLHFYKLHYAGEVVDQGDTSCAVGRAGYFGAQFDASLARYRLELARTPPRYVLSGDITDSPAMHALLASGAYREVAAVRDHYVFYPFWHARLWARDPERSAGLRVPGAGSTTPIDAECLLSSANPRCVKAGYR